MDPSKSEGSDRRGFVISWIRQLLLDRLKSLSVNLLETNLLRRNNDGFARYVSGQCRLAKRQRRFCYRSHIRGPAHGEATRGSSSRARRETNRVNWFLS